MTMTAIRIWALGAGGALFVSVAPGAVAAQASSPPAPMPPMTSAPRAASPTSPPVAALPRQAGYLGPEHVPDSLAILPPPPTDPTDAEKEDVRVFLDTRKLQGQPRWDLAARDAVNYLGAYDCALGVTLDLSKTPRLRTVLGRAGADASTITNRSKDSYRRPRPFVGNAQPICREDQRAGLTKSWSYPSGHATFGWTVGLILAELAPDKATALLMRARAFGESRVVCGVHFESDIEEGRTTGSALVAALHSDPDFRADIDAARTELAALRASGGQLPEAGECKVENDAAGHTPWKR